MKRNEMLSLWTRPTIGWSLTCEGYLENGYPRKYKVLDLAQEARIATDADKIGYSKKVDWVFIASLILIVMVLMALLAG